MGRLTELADVGSRELDRLTLLSGTFDVRAHRADSKVVIEPDRARYSADR